MSVESVGVEQLRPVQDDCLACGCCTRVLCEKGRTRVLGCADVASPESVPVVRGCPCSAETTAGTAAYDAARVRAAMHAELRPLQVQAESALRSVDAGLPVDTEDEALGVLRVFRYVEDTVGGLRVSVLGRMYLSARDGGR